MSETLSTQGLPPILPDSCSFSLTTKHTPAKPNPQLPHQNTCSKGQPISQFLIPALTFRTFSSLDPSFLLVPARTSQEAGASCFQLLFDLPLAQETFYDFLVLDVLVFGIQQVCFSASVGCPTLQPLGPHTAPDLPLKLKSVVNFTLSIIYYP